MIDEQVLQEQVESAIASKERLFKENPDDCDVPPTFQVWGTDGPTLQFLIQGLPRNHYPALMAIAAAASPSFLLQISEAYCLAQPKDGDETLEDAMKKHQYEPGEMSRMFQAGDPTIIETIMILGMDHDGNTAWANLPFRKENGELVWLEENRTFTVEHYSASTTLRGFMAEAMHDAMMSPTIFDQMKVQGLSPDQFGITQREAELHTACVAAKIALQHDIATGFMLRSQEEVDLVNESMKHGPEAGNYKFVEFRS